MDKVRYYELGFYGWEILQGAWWLVRLRVLSGRRHLVKPNQLLFRRIAEGRSLSMAANPVNMIDLKHLEALVRQNRLGEERPARCMYQSTNQ